MKVFVTGGTGFVGRRIVSELLRREHQAVLLVRKADPLAGVEGIIGDVTLADSIRISDLTDCRAAIHLVGVIREFPARGITFDRLHVDATRNVLEACRQAGIRRYIHMSAMGANEISKAAYHRTKAHAEELVRSSNLDWTIIRPSLILGRSGEFTRMIRKMVRRRIVPLIGRGSSCVAPVAVSTVAQAFVSTLENENAVGRIYDLCGEAMTYRQMMKALAREMGKRVLFVRVPEKLVCAYATLLDRYPSFPITREQIVMMKEASAPVDYSVYDELGLEFKEVKEVMREAIQEDG
jgi:NADH dehydrogenase